MVYPLAYEDIWRFVSDLNGGNDFSFANFQDWWVKPDSPNEPLFQNMAESIAIEANTITRTSRLAGGPHSSWVYSPIMAGVEGLEPPILSLTARRSTIELHSNK